MTNRLKSIMGRDLGLDHDGVLICPKGFVAGDFGKQTTLPSPDKVVLLDDFLGALLNAGQWLSTVSGTAGAPIATNAIPLTPPVGTSGILRMTAPSAAGTKAANQSGIAGSAQWRPTAGGLAMQVRFKLTAAITSRSLFFGFTNALRAAATSPLTRTTTSNTAGTGSTEVVGVMLNTDATEGTVYQLAGIKSAGTPVLVTTTLAPVADQYETWRVEINAAGVARFYRNGIVVQQGTTLISLTAATNLVPVFYCGDIVGDSKVTDIDYIHVVQNRGLDGTAV